MALFSAPGCGDDDPIDAADAGRDSRADVAEDATVHDAAHGAGEDAAVRDADALASDAAVDSGRPQGSDAGSSDDDAGPIDPWYPPSDACALYAADATDLLAKAACVGVGTFVRGDFSDPFDQLLADVSRRRFGVAALDGMWDAYAAALVSVSDTSAELRVFARIGDASTVAAPEDLAMLGPLDTYTSAALYCDMYPLPASYPDALSQALATGGYNATHVLLALMWLSDNGCVDPTGAAFHEDVFTNVAALIDTDLSSVTDLEIEAAAFLTYSGEGARVRAGFADALLATQRADGGWAGDPSELTSSGHPTGLAIWYLHELLFPKRSETMVTKKRPGPGL